MRQGVPKITAPLSRTKRSSHGNSFTIGMVCALLSSIFAFGGTIILILTMTSSSRDIGVRDDGVVRKGGVTPALRQSQSSVNESTEKKDLSRNKMSAEKIDPSNAEGLIIHTYLGDIRIHFTSKLAGPESIRYVTDVVLAASSKQNNGMGYSTAETMNGRKITEGYKCQKCIFYRAEKQLLLQGSISESSVKRNNMKGPCPDESYTPKLKCPAHDPNCGCHGPIMTKGMVGWAGGGTGPEFFINTFAKPVDWWENQHTVWGEIRDEISLKVVESAYDLDAHISGMRMLDQPIEFSLELF
mmetsp:Transcript_8534/g.20881  ORF Transcript_8534/g.20881 Transcript_8534/m.20881 type:complete len:299 (+) Transcript_8534:232-1128(+)